MAKARRSVFIRNSNWDKLHDVQYFHRKDTKKKISISEIINKIIEHSSIKQISRIIK